MCGPPVELLANEVAVVPRGGKLAIEKLVPFASADRSKEVCWFMESMDVAGDTPSESLLRPG